MSDDRSERKLKILFVCLANQQRSPTAERLANEEFADKIEARSCGCYCSEFGIQITPELAGWADEVVCMDREVMDYVMKNVRTHLKPMSAVCLHIADEYSREDPTLVAKLRESLTSRAAGKGWLMHGEPRW